MAKAKKLPSGSWRAQVYNYTDSTGKRYYESFTSDDQSPAGKREAEYLAAEYAMNKKRKSRSCNLTVKEAVAQYIEMKKPVLSPSTLRGYTNLYRNAFHAIEPIHLRDLQQSEIQSWIGIIAVKYAPKTIANAHGLLTAVLDAYIPELKVKTTLPQKKKNTLYVPTDNDVKKILDLVQGKELELAIYLAAFGTMRRGEICALESSDIHGTLVSVNKSMARTVENKWVIKQPKTYSSYREIEFPQFVIDKLSGVEGRIIKATPDQITNRFTRAIDTLGISRFRFHDLRHYSASIMHAIGVPDQYIMKRGGWGSDRTLKEVYRNVLEDQDKKFTSITNKHFDQIMQHEMQHD